MRLHELPQCNWWAIVTALRGPDFGSAWGLKYVFTARVRAWVASVFEGFDVCGFDTREGPLTKGLVEQARSEAQNLRFAAKVNYAHWASHLYAALTVLFEHLNGDDQREAKFLLLLLCSDPEDWTKLFEQESTVGGEKPCINPRGRP
jgi:hypothetical protein